MSDPDGPTPRLDAGALERILDVTRALARPMELGAMLESVIDAARSVLAADRGTVFLYDKDAGELVAKVATGESEIRVPADRGIVGECVRTRRVINVPDCYADARFNPEVDRKTGYRTRCLMTVPLIGHDDALQGVLQVLNKADGVFGAEDETLATALGAQCAVALQRARWLGDRLARERMERELDVARRIQMRVLPQTMPELPGYDVAGWCRPADQAGGDIFDLQRLDDGRLAVLLADATGHGIGPALSVTQFRAMLRICLRLGVGLDDAVQHLNEQLCEDLSDRRFVTALLGRLDPAGHTLDYVAAGQGPLLHYHAAAERAEWFGSTARPLGMLGGLPLGGRAVLTLAPGDVFLAATDGLFEHEDAQEAQFGEDRVADVVRRHRDGPSGELIARLVDAVEGFASGTRQADDMTIVVIRRPKIRTN